MLADAPLPHSSGANLAVVGTLSEGFGRIVASPPYLVGYVRWDARSDRFTSLCQTIFFDSFTDRTLTMSLATPGMFRSCRRRHTEHRVSFPRAGCGKSACPVRRA